MNCHGKILPNLLRQNTCPRETGQDWKLFPFRILRRILFVWHHIKIMIFPNVLITPTVSWIWLSNKMPKIIKTWRVLPMSSIICTRLKNTRRLNRMAISHHRQTCSTARLNLLLKKYKEFHFQVYFVFICIVNHLFGIVELTLDRKGHLDFVSQFVLSIDSSLKVEHRRLKYVLFNDLFYSLNYL